MLSRRKRVLVIRAGAMALLLVALVWGAIPSALDPFDDSPFDPIVWTRWQGVFHHDNERGHMARSLIRKLEMDRPHRSEVVVLLGPTDRECSVLTPPLGQKETCLSYYLGDWSGYRMDPDTLDVYFSGDGRVSNVVTVQH